MADDVMSAMRRSLPGALKLIGASAVAVASLALVASCSAGAAASHGPTAPPGAGHAGGSLPRQIRAFQVISCSTVKYCVAAGVGGTAYTNNGGTSWSASMKSPPTVHGKASASLSAVSCPAVRFCVADVSGPGNPIVITTNSGASWSEPAAGAGFGLSGVSCPTASRCVAVGSYKNGQAALFTTNGGATWTREPMPNPGGTFGDTYGPISCSTASDCVTISDFDKSEITTDGGRSWSSGGALPSSLVKVSAVECPTPSECLALGQTSGSALVYTRNGGSSWSMAKLPPGIIALNGISCPTASHCVAITSNIEGAGESASGPAVIVTKDGGTSWSVGYPLPKPVVRLDLLSCPTATVCVGIAGWKTLISDDGGIAW